MNIMVFWDICNNHNEIRKYLKFLLVTVSVLRFSTSGYCQHKLHEPRFLSFLTWILREPYLWPESLKVSPEVDSLQFRSLLFISCKQFSKGPLFLSPKEQVIFKTSQGIFMYNPFPTPPNQQNLKDKVLDLVFTVWLRFLG